ncbi:MAG: protein-L-isoaspartate O-methyltransferase [Candidatus Thermoplasmatota archaeon]|nr:protein-L-isoaspartate O-methyltransferase [Candidatus Thermoplasmatota archaeon]
MRKRMTVFLDHVRHDAAFREKMNERISIVMDLIREGRDITSVGKMLKMPRGDLEIIYEIAKARIKVSHKFSLYEKVWLDQYLSSFSTPEVVCNYRAGRISGMNLMDIGSGSGIQTAIMSRYNLSTVGIESDADRHLMSVLNGEVYGGRNLRFIRGDGIRILETSKISDNTVVFSDPARPPGAAERKLEDLTPSPEAVMAAARGKTENFVFDLPPQMKWSNLTIPGEKEYISVDGSLNRLTLYTGEVSKSQVSAVILPRGIRIMGTPEDSPPVSGSCDDDYLYSFDPAVIRAKLVRKVISETGINPVASDKRRYLASASTIIDMFPGEIYEVIFTSSSSDISTELHAADAGRVFLRYGVQDGSYYEARDSLSPGLSGSRDIYLFRIGEKTVGAGKIAARNTA